jgi:hypothetical protein
VFVSAAGMAVPSAEGIVVVVSMIIVVACLK